MEQVGVSGYIEPFPDWSDPVSFPWLVSGDVDRSLYKITAASCADSDYFSKSFVAKMNKKLPSSVPCGAPPLNNLLLDRVFPILNCICRSYKKERTIPRTPPETPMFWWVLMQWRCHIELNAFAKSTDINEQALFS